MFQLGARQDLWDNVHQNLLMNFHSDPFPAFPVSSSGVFVFRHLLDGRGFRVHNGDLQIAVHNTVVSTSLQPKQLCDLVQSHACFSTTKINNHDTFFVSMSHLDVCTFE